MTKNGNPSDADIIADALDTFHPGCAANWPIVQAVVTALANRAASRPAQEPVSWQVRYMYDKGHAREKEWCDWRNTNKRWFDKINADIAAGVQRVEARALYAAPVSLTGEER